MPDLEITAVSEWIASYQPKPGSDAADDIRLLDPPDGAGLLALEADPPCEAAVQAFGAGLDRALDFDPQRLSAALREEQTRLAGVIARLNLGRQARVIDWIAQSGVPNGIALVRTLAKPGEDGIGDAIRDGMVDLYRQQLLARLFSKARLAALLEACRISAKELP